MKFTHILAAVTIGGVALGVSGAAMAQVRVGVNVGGPVYAVPPPPVYAAPVYGPPPVMVIGWQRDGRYWDGHRYWRRDEWYRHHGRGGHWHR